MIISECLFCCHWWYWYYITWTKTYLHLLWETYWIIHTLEPGHHDVTLLQNTEACRRIVNSGVIFYFQFCNWYVKFGTYLGWIWQRIQTNQRKKWTRETWLILCCPCKVNLTRPTSMWWKKSVSHLMLFWNFSPS